MLMGIITNYSVYRLMVASSSLLSGFILFSTVTLTLRIFASVYFLRESIGHLTWIALGLLMLAKFLQNADRL